MFMSTNDGKNENLGFIKIAIAIIAILLEVLCVAGIKYIDACQRGDNLSSSAATTEATTQQSDDDIDDTTAQTDTNDTEEQSVSAGDICDLSQKNGTASQRSSGVGDTGHVYRYKTGRKCF